MITADERDLLLFELSKLDIQFLENVRRLGRKKRDRANFGVPGLVEELAEHGGRVGNTDPGYDDQLQAAAAGKAGALVDCVNEAQLRIARFDEFAGWQRRVEPAGETKLHRPPGPDALTRGESTPKKSRRKIGKAIDGYVFRQNMVVGGWRLDKELGFGGQGEVWRVRHQVDRGPPRAMKVCVTEEPKARARFEQELELLTQVEHDNVVPVIDSRVEWEPLGPESEEAAWFVMPLACGSIAAPELAGHTLKLLDFFNETCSGVQALHDHVPPVLHRDLKPSNVLILEEHRRAVVADLGIATEEDGQGSLTGTQEVVGTQFYRAPEVASGGEASVRSDIYGLGRILERILTGSEPVALSPRQMPRTSLVPEHVACALDRVVARAAAFDPADRYACVALLMEDLPTLVLDIVDAGVRPRSGDQDSASVRSGPVYDLSALRLPRPGEEVAWIRSEDAPDHTAIRWSQARGPGFGFVHLRPSVPLERLSRLKLRELVKGPSGPRLPLLGLEDDLVAVPALGPRGGVVFGHYIHADQLGDTVDIVSFLEPEGTLIGVDNMLVGDGSERWDLVPGGIVERNFIRGLEGFVAFLGETVGGRGPFIATVGLTSTSGSVLMMPGSERSHSEPTPEDPIAYRFVVADGAGARELLEPFFSHLWEAYAEDRRPLPPPDS